MTLPVHTYQFTKPTQQFVGKGNSIGGSFASGISQFTEQWQFEQSYFPTVVSDILGYSTDAITQGLGAGNFGSTMARVLPVRCVQFPWLWASRINSIEGIGNEGARLGIHALGTMSSWKLMRLTVQYESPPYEIVEDGVVAGLDAKNTPAESLRYVIWGQTPASEFVQSTVDSFCWSTRVHNKYPDVIQGSKGYALLVSKIRISGNWIQVCDDWVRNGSNRFGNIEAALGTVNDANFLDRPPGTMLFESYKAVPRSEPVDPVVMNQLNHTSQIPRAWDIELNWTYFDPTAGGTLAAITGDQPTANGKRTHGHNLAFDPVTAKWWRPILNVSGGAQAILDSDKNGYWKYRESDHSLIFKHYQGH